MITLDQSQLAAVFTEWERRYREEPERFMSEGEKLLKETPASYGEACAPYFLKIAEDLGLAHRRKPTLEDAQIRLTLAEASLAEARAAELRSAPDPAGTG